MSPHRRLPNRVVVVGAGPAGLTAATELRRRGVPEVIVHDREQHGGGAPWHTDHLGFGLRDRHRLLRGPAYAARLVADARTAGVELRLGSPVFERPDADAVILATGARERPRSARLVPGDRPNGVHTTGSLQQLAVRGMRVGTRAVIVGAEHVSFSAIWTLRHVGCAPVALVTPARRHGTVWPLKLATATRHRVPVITDVDVAAIIGRGRVEAVLLSDGQRIECDTVVFTGSWVPENELARAMGVAIDHTTRSPLVGEHWSTSLEGVYAVGNAVLPVRAADACALDGRRLARWLAG